MDKSICTDDENIKSTLQEIIDKIDHNIITTKCDTDDKGSDLKKKADQEIVKPTAIDKKNELECIEMSKDTISTEQPVPDHCCIVTHCLETIATDQTKKFNTPIVGVSTTQRNQWTGSLIDLGKNEEKVQDNSEEDMCFDNNLQLDETIATKTEAVIASSSLSVFKQENDQKSLNASTTQKDQLVECLPHFKVEKIQDKFADNLCFDNIMQPHAKYATGQEIINSRNSIEVDIPKSSASLFHSKGYSEIRQDNCTNNFDNPQPDKPAKEKMSESMCNTDFNLDDSNNTATTSVQQDIMIKKVTSSESPIISTLVDLSVKSVPTSSSSFTSTSTMHHNSKQTHLNQVVVKCDTNLLSDGNLEEVKQSESAIKKMETMVANVKSCVSAVNEICQAISPEIRTIQKRKENLPKYVKDMDKKEEQKSFAKSVSSFEHDTSSYDDNDDDDQADDNNMMIIDDCPEGDVEEGGWLKCNEQLIISNVSPAAECENISHNETVDGSTDAETITSSAIVSENSIITEGKSIVATTSTLVASTFDRVSKLPQDYVTPVSSEHSYAHFGIVPKVLPPKEVQDVVPASKDNLSEPVDEKQSTQKETSQANPAGGFDPSILRREMMKLLPDLLKELQGMNQQQAALPSSNAQVTSTKLHEISDAPMEKVSESYIKKNSSANMKSSNIITSNSGPAITPMRTIAPKPTRGSKAGARLAIKATNPVPIAPKVYKSQVKTVTPISPSLVQGITHDVPTMAGSSATILPIKDIQKDLVVYQKFVDHNGEVSFAAVSPYRPNAAAVAFGKSNVGSNNLPLNAQRIVGIQEFPAPLQSRYRPSLENHISQAEPCRSSKDVFSPSTSKNILQRCHNALLPSSPIPNYAAIPKNDAQHYSSNTSLLSKDGHHQKNVAQRPPTLEVIVAESKMQSELLPKSAVVEGHKECESVKDAVYYKDLSKFIEPNKTILRRKMEIGHATVEVDDIIDVKIVGNVSYCHVKWVTHTWEKEVDVLNGEFSQLCTRYNANKLQHKTTSSVTTEPIITNSTFHNLGGDVSAQMKKHIVASLSAEKIDAVSTPAKKSDSSPGSLQSLPAFNVKTVTQLSNSTLFYENSRTSTSLGNIQGQSNTITGITSVNKNTVPDINDSDTVFEVDREDKAERCQAAQNIEVKKLQKNYKSYIPQKYVKVNPILCTDKDEEKRKVGYKEFDFAGMLAKEKVVAKHTTPGQKKFKCRHCCQKYTRSDLQKHDRIFKKLVCPQCHLRMCSKKRLTKHILQHAKSTMQCSSCCKVFKDKHRYQVHKSTAHAQLNTQSSSDSDEYKFVRRDKVLLSKQLLSRKRKVKDAKYKSGKAAADKCKICLKAFLSKEKLEKHTLLHGVSHKECKQCEECFDVDEDESNHTCTGIPRVRFVFHYEDTISKLKETQKGTTTADYWTKRAEKMRRSRPKKNCVQCIQGFKNRESFYEHINVKECPNLKDSGQCMLCKQFFSSLENLKAHVMSCFKDSLTSLLRPQQRSATENQPERKRVVLHCSYCKALFPSIVAYRNHRKMLHPTGEKYHCVKCGYSCRSKPLLKMHLRRKKCTKVSIYPCFVCDQNRVHYAAFGSLSALVGHMKAHTNDKRKQNVASLTSAPPRVLPARLQNELGATQLLSLSSEDLCKLEGRPALCEVPSFGHYEVMLNGYPPDEFLSATKLLVCFDCKTPCRDRKHLMGHFRGHHRWRFVQLSICKPCGFAFKDSSSYQTHKRQCPSSKLLNKTVKSPVLEKVSRPPPVQLKCKECLDDGLDDDGCICDICSTKLACSHALDIHRRDVHPLPYVFICELCKQHFCTVKEYDAHRECIGRSLQTMIITKPCYVCKKPVKDVKSHVISHIPVIYECYRCNSKLSNKSQLMKHLQHVHKSPWSKDDEDWMESLSKARFSMVIKNLCLSQEGKSILCDEKDLAALSSVNVKCHNCNVLFFHNETLLYHQAICKFTSPIFVAKSSVATRQLDLICIKCFICSRLFDDHDSCLAHVVVSHNVTKKDIHERYMVEVKLNKKKLHSCNVCGAHFTDEEALWRHRFNHVGVAVERCYVCTKTFPTAKELKIHTYLQHSAFYCQICYKVFHKYDAFMLHSQLHILEVNVPRDDNGKMMIEIEPRKLAVLAKERLFPQGNPEQGRFVVTPKIPKEILGDSRLFHCYVCEKNIEGELTFIVHMKTHSVPRRLCCLVCKRTFDQEDKLVEHIERHFGVCVSDALEEENEQSDDDQLNKCYLCCQVFETLQELREHEDINKFQPKMVQLLKGDIITADVARYCFLKEPEKICLTGNKWSVDWRLAKKHDLEKILSGLINGITPHPETVTNAKLGPPLCPHCLTKVPKCDAKQHMRKHKNAYSAQFEVKCLVCDVEVGLRNLPVHMMDKHLEALDLTQPTVCPLCLVVLQVDEIGTHQVKHQQDLLLLSPFAHCAYCNDVLPKEKLSMHMVSRWKSENRINEKEVAALTSSLDALSEMQRQELDVKSIPLTKSVDVEITDMTKVIEIVKKIPLTKNIDVEVVRDGSVQHHTKETRDQNSSSAKMEKERILTSTAKKRLKKETTNKSKIEEVSKKANKKESKLVDAKKQKNMECRPPDTKSKGTDSLNSDTLIKTITTTVCSEAEVTETSNNKVNDDVREVTSPVVSKKVRGSFAMEKIQAGKGKNAGGNTPVDFVASATSPRKMLKQPSVIFVQENELENETVDSEIWKADTKKTKNWSIKKIEKITSKSSSIPSGHKVIPKSEILPLRIPIGCRRPFKVANVTNTLQDSRTRLVNAVMTGLEKPICRVCDWRFNAFGELKIHLTKHYTHSTIEFDEGSRDVCCVFCRGLIRKTSMKTHLLLKHPKEQVQHKRLNDTQAKRRQNKSPEVKQNSASPCAQVTVPLELASSQNAMPYPFTCAVCGKGYFSSSPYLTHFKINHPWLHEEEKQRLDKEKDKKRKIKAVAQNSAIKRSKIETGVHPSKKSAAVNESPKKAEVMQPTVHGTHNETIPMKSGVVDEEPNKAKLPSAFAVLGQWSMPAKRGRHRKIIRPGRPPKAFKEEARKTNDTERKISEDEAEVIGDTSRLEMEIVEFQPGEITQHEAKLAKQKHMLDENEKPFKSGKVTTPLNSDSIDVDIQKENSAISSHVGKRQREKPYMEIAKDKQKSLDEEESDSDSEVEEETEEEIMETSSSSDSETEAKSNTTGTDFSNVGAKNKFFCPHCHLGFPCQTEVSSHLTVHESHTDRHFSVPYPYVCLYCGSGFYKTYSLRKHLQGKHSLLYTVGLENKDCFVNRALGIEQDYERTTTAPVISDQLPKRSRSKFNELLDSLKKNSKVTTPGTNTSDAAPRTSARKRTINEKVLNVLQAKKKTPQKDNSVKKEKQSVHPAKIVKSEGSVKKEREKQKSETEDSDEESEEEQVCETEENNTKGDGEETDSMVEDWEDSSSDDQESQAEESQTSKESESEDSESDTSKANSKQSSSDIYICEYCDIIAKSGKSLKVHVKAHLANKSSPERNTLCCTACEERVVRHELKWHMHTRHNGDKKVKLSNKRKYCALCNFACKRGMEKHLSENHPELLKVECRLCDLRFSTHQQCKSHFKDTHGKTIDEESLMCFLCNKKFHTLSNLHFHYSIVHMKKKENLHCSLCSKYFHSQTNLNKHEEEFHKNDKFQCGLCLLEFDEAELCEEHVGNHKKKTKHECQKCYFFFQSKDELHEHAKTHKQQGFSCEICHVKFDIFSEFEAHKLLVHNSATACEKKQYACATCRDSFKTKEECSIHERTHSIQRTYQCTSCDESYNSIAQIRLHMDDVHQSGARVSCSDTVVADQDTASESENQLPLMNKCDVCGETFLRPEIFMEHRKKHK